MKPAYIFTFLSLGFAAFSLSIYLKSALEPRYGDRQKAAEGRLIWQKYNCQSCHQLYGLGGYLGPDLTNVYSAPGKGEPLIRALLKTGTGQMPAFDMSEEETGAMISFLKATDASGSADPKDFTILATGMTKRK